MRHRRAGRKFGLPSDQRKALLKSLTRSVLMYDRILTTETRAKDVQPIVEKLVTLARRGGADAPVPARLHARRMVRRYVDSNVDEFIRVPGTKKGSRVISRNPHYVVPRLFDVIAPRTGTRAGGYTRITKVQFRRGDGAPLVMLEFVDESPIAAPEPVTEEKAPARASRRKKAASQE